MENPSGVIAPTQSGKTLMDLVHKTLHAPGSLLVTSTKVDLFQLTALHRERRGGPGSVLVLDLTGTTHWPHTLRWNPIDGCHDWRTATRRAKALIAGVRPGKKSGGGGNHEFFESRAGEVLACYLQAAALTHTPTAEFVAWCMDETDTRAADILLDRPDTRDHGIILTKAQGLVPQTRDGVWESLRDAISCLTDPLTRAVCGDYATTGAEPTFDIANYLTGEQTIYVLGSEETAADLAPLVTAFVEHVFFEARDYALRGRGGRDRLDPPSTAVLDELPNICPLPGLPGTISDSAGRGLIIHWAAQSESQLVTAFDREGAITLIDNTTALTAFGGLKSRETLEWLSVLAGRRIEERTSRKSELIGVNLDRNISQERVEVLTPGQIRELPTGRVLVMFRSLPPLIAVTRKAWELREWGQLQQDRERVAALGRDRVEAATGWPELAAAP